MDLPSDLHYTPEHEWARAEDGVITVGITDFAQDSLGDVVYVSLPAVGDRVEAGGACGEVESTKSVSDIYAPVAGEVVEVNSELADAPDLLNQDPYGQGWMFRVRLDDPAGAEALLAGLLDAHAYRGLTES